MYSPSLWSSSGEISEPVKVADRLRVDWLQNAEAAPIRELVKQPVVLYRGPLEHRKREPDPVHVPSVDDHTVYGAEGTNRTTLSRPNAPFRWLDAELLTLINRTNVVLKNVLEN